MRLASLWRSCLAGVTIGIAASVMVQAQGGPPVPQKQGAPGKTTAPTPPPGKTQSRSLNIVVPVAGDYTARLLPSADAKDPNQLPITFQDRRTVISFDPSVLGKNPRIAIDDVAKGKTAVKPIPSSDTLELRPMDFDRLRLLEVKVLSDNRPVRAAVVTLTAADRSSQSKTIDTSSQGTARFEDVPVGSATLKLQYGDGFIETRDIQVTNDHPEGVQSVEATVTNRVPTLDTPAAGQNAPPSTGGMTGGGSGLQPAPGLPPSSSAPQSQSGGGLVGLVGTLLGLSVGAGAIYLLYRWAQSGGMAATLKKAGIEVSGPAPPSDAGAPWKPNAPPPPVVADPSLCPFCGEKRDSSGSCACTLAPGAGAGVSSGVTPAVPTQPRLVASVGVYSGSIFPLAFNGSGITVGRDPTNTISLSNDTTVSRRHASFNYENGTYIITDEGSSNGIYVNGVRISGSQPLRPGDEVQIGNTRFRFEV
jgi:hypothetical protein